MATPEEIKAQQQGIQNSEKLLDLSNQLNTSITERRKLLKNISEEEQQYFATVKQQQKLSMDIAANAEKYLGFQIKSKDLSKQITAIEDNNAKSKFAFSAIENKLNNDRAKAISKIKDLYQKEIAQKQDITNLDSQINQKIAQRNAAELRGNRALANQLSQEIREETKALQSKEKSLQKILQQKEAQISLSNTTKEQIKNGKKALEAQEKEIAFLRENLRIRKQIEKSTGLLGGMAKAVSKIPGIGQYLNADEAIDEMEKLAAEIEKNGGKATSFANRMQIAGRGLSVLAKGAYENLKSPEAIFTFFLKAALTANDQVVKLGKSLGYAGGRAESYRETLAGIERRSNNINVTTKNLVEAFGELSKATGLAYEFTEDQLETQIKLTKQVGLTADEAAQIQRFAVLNNKTSEETYKSFLKGITAARNQLKVGIDFKATLAEAVKVSGQLAANLGNNPELIGKAIVTAEALGMTLEQVAKAGKSLLDFGTSISNELEAELLTGKQLNLERARAAALAGDQVTLAEELAKNVGTAAEFTKMNVLQQQSLAKSVGMEADELANTLRKREEAIASGKSLAQINEEEVKKALERQSVQDKFNAAVEKLQSLFGNLMAGPLGSFLDVLSGALNIVNLIGHAFSFMAGPLQVIIGLYATLKGIQLVSLGISKSIAFYESLKYGYAVGQRSMALGYNGILVARQALLSGELSKSIAIAAAWAVANWPVAALGLAAATAIAAGLYAITADDMAQPGYGKRTILSPEGAIKLNDNDTIIAGTNLGGGSKTTKPTLTPTIDNTILTGTNLNKGNKTTNPTANVDALIASTDRMHAKMEQLLSRPSVAVIDGESAFSSRVATSAARGTYKPA
jgi:hypothetical protein